MAWWKNTWLLVKGTTGQSYFFLGGLTKLDRVEVEAYKSVLSKKIHPSFCQLLYEAQNTTLVESVFANGEFHAYAAHYSNPMHCYVYGYCIAYSSSTANWVVGMGNLSEKSLCLFEKGLKLCQRGRITTIEFRR